MDACVSILCYCEEDLPGQVFNLFEYADQGLLRKEVSRMLEERWLMSQAFRVLRKMLGIALP